MWEEYININWEQYKKVTNKCSTCGKEMNWVHWCSWPDYWNGTIAINIVDNAKSDCLWDSMPETTPWSWIKLWALSCPCRKCSPYC